MKHGGMSPTKQHSQVAEYQSRARELNRMAKTHRGIDLVDARSRSM